MNFSDNSGIIGSLKITERNIKTGEILNVIEDDNVVLTQGKLELLKAFNSLNDNSHKVKSIVVGSDFGSGTILEPEQPNASYTELDQDVVYEIPEAEFFVEYPSENSTRYLATINGAAVMAMYPTVPNVTYTSASIITQAGKAVAYRRFGARTISALISIDVAWTLTII